MRVDLVNLLGSGSSPSPSLLAEWRVGAILEAIAVRDAAAASCGSTSAASDIRPAFASGDASGPQNGERLQVRVLAQQPGARARNGVDDSRPRRRRKAPSSPMRFASSCRGSRARRCCWRISPGSHNARAAWRHCRAPSCRRPRTCGMRCRRPRRSAIPTRSKPPSRARAYSSKRISPRIAARSIRASRPISRR